MPDETDPAFELARCAQQFTLRAWLRWEESRQMLLRLRLKGLDENIKGARQALSRITDAPDWNSFHGLPAQIAAAQIERNAAHAREFGSLYVEMASTFMEHLRESAEAWQDYQKKVMVEGACYAPLSESARVIFDNVGRMMAVPSPGATASERRPAAQI
ncbi:hypothetical protein [Cupriavidus lacunae]|uniref:Phasin domain-containing protein n=1 Tax=Cupriavidus lacunae TaxID=2666307 RepID=A0A370NLB8_9BURK|nr:hypothetical protein [Cupriavidus lacunae]RDK06390.1 hypothetical protein DN412_31730 [Cupriavidus lacunae]